MQFDIALARLQELPDDDRRAELELDIRNKVQWALMTLKGYGSPEGELSAARALELARRPGVSWEKSWMALWGLHVTAGFRANVSQAGELAAELLAIAEQHGNHELTAGSLCLLGFSQMFAAKLDQAAECIDRAISLYEAMPKATVGLGWGRPRHTALAYGSSAWNTWFLGFPNRAAKQMNEVFALARGLHSKVIEELVNDSAVWFFFWLRERERIRDHAAAMVTLATEMGNPYRRSLGEFYLGWIDSVEHDRPEVIERMQRALAVHRATGSLIGCHLCFRSLRNRKVALPGTAKPLSRSMKRSRLLSRPANACLKPRFTGSRESYCSHRIYRQQRKQKTRSEPRSTLPSGRTLNHGSCARRSASRDCCVVPNAGKRRARRLPKSTTGSPRASTPPI